MLIVLFKKDPNSHIVIVTMVIGLQLILKIQTVIHVIHNVKDVPELLTIVLNVQKTELVNGNVLANQDILNNILLIVHSVTTNVVNVQHLPLIVLLVVVLDSQPQVVHVQPNIMN
jgi:hypothetical protein